MTAPVTESMLHTVSLPGSVATSRQAKLSFQASSSGVSVSAYAAMAAKAQSNPASLTAQERAVRAQPSIPYNLDAWDGYPAARQRLLDAFAAGVSRNPIVITGDIHESWVADLHLGDVASPVVATELVGTSITSPPLSTTACSRSDSRGCSSRPDAISRISGKRPPSRASVSSRRPSARKRSSRRLCFL